jgi:hypothetical protein
VARPQVDDRLAAHMDGERGAHRGAGIHDLGERLSHGLERGLAASMNLGRLGTQRLPPLIAPAS